MATLGGQFVLFGGSDGGDLPDMWTWNGATCTRLDAWGMPRPRK